MSVDEQLEAYVNNTKQTNNPQYLHVSHLYQQATIKEWKLKYPYRILPQGEICANWGQTSIFCCWVLPSPPAKGWQTGWTGDLLRPYCLPQFITVVEITPEYIPNFKYPVPSLLLQMRKAGPNRKTGLYYLGLSITTAFSSCKFAQNKHFLITQVIWKNFVGLFLSYFIWLYLIPCVPSKCSIPNLAQLISSYTSSVTVALEHFLQHLNVLQCPSWFNMSGSLKSCIDTIKIHACTVSYNT